MVIKALQHLGSEKVKDSCILADEAREGQITWSIVGHAMEVGFH